jgi:hypothetical protein
MRFFILGGIIGCRREWFGKLATAEYNKNDYVIASKNTEGGVF